jgi:large subunit ribosomal protein L25
MKSLKIAGQKREGLGKKEAKKLRGQGLIPGVLYGKDEAIHFALSFSDLRSFVYTPSVYLIDLDIDGKSYKAMIQDIQWHPVEEQIMHIDFLKVEDNVPVKIGIPVELTGTAKGIKAGGKIKFNMRKLRVKGLAENLPDTIKVNVTKLGIGDSIKVETLKRDNLEFLDNKSNLIVAVISTRLAKSASELLEEEEEEEAAAAAAEEDATASEATETKE